MKGGSRVSPKQNTPSGLPRLLPAFIVVYCVLQPLLDVMGYWQQQLGLGNALTTGIRTVLLVGSAALGFLISRRKWAYAILGAILALLIGLHIAANLPGGYPQAGADLSNLIRIVSLPITTLCFISFLREGGQRVWQSIKIGLSVDLLIILLVELLSVLTGTNRSTYVKEEIGVIGWFLWGNCQSAILSMLTPMVICWTLERCRTRLLPVALVTAGAETALFFFGTRLTFAAMLASGIGVCCCLLLIDRQRWRQAVTVLLITALFALAYPVSPAALRLNALEANALSSLQPVQTQAESTPSAVPADPACEITAPELPIDEAPAAETPLPSAPAEPIPQVSAPEPPIEEAPTAETPLPPAPAEEERGELELLYRRYFSAVIDRFGMQRVAEKYNYTQDPAVLGDIRTCKRMVCEMVMEDAPTLCHFFGLNVRDLYITVRRGEDTLELWVPEEQEISFEVENDFHGIYFVLGAVGLGLILAFLLYFGLRALISVLRDFRGAFTLDMVALAGAYVFGLVHAYFTTSVLRRNNASVYLALVLAGLWYLSQKPRGAEESSAVPLAERRTHESK